MEENSKKYKFISDIKTGDEYYVACTKPFIAIADKAEVGFNDTKEMVIKLSGGKDHKTFEVPVGVDSYEVSPGFIVMADKNLFQESIRPIVQEKIAEALAVLKYCNKLMEPVNTAIPITNVEG